MSAPVIIGIDGSAHAWRALDWAADYAARHGLEVRLVHASRALVHGGRVTEDTLRRLTAEREDLLRRAREHTRKLHPDLEISARLVAADAGRALVEESRDAALLAVGLRGIGDFEGFEGMLFGSVGRYALAHAECPVLVVPASAPYPTDAPAELIVGIEGRHREDVLIAWVFAEASSRGARIVALHTLGREASRQQRRVVEERVLSEALASLSARYPDVQVDRVVSDHTLAKALVEAAGNAALLVVGAHRRHGLFGVPLDRAVLHHVRCPVVVVPSPAVASGDGHVQGELSRPSP